MSYQSQYTLQLQGRSGYLLDYKEENMLYAVTIRSPSSKGQGIKVNLPELPDDAITLSHKDIPGNSLIDIDGLEIPVLAGEWTEYAGEPVMLIAGPSQSILSMLALKTQVTLNQEDVPNLDFTGYEEDQVEASWEYKRGDPATLTENAFQLIEASYSTPLQEHFYPEPLCAFARYEEDRVKIYCPTQWLYHVRDSVASVLNIPKKRVEVIGSELGPHLDGKIWYPSIIACHAALLSRKSGKAVKIIYNREEDFKYSPKRSPVVVNHKTALTKNGDLLAMDIEILINGGAYPVFGERLLKRMCFAASGVYRCSDIRVRGKVLRTNMPPAGVFQGFGMSQVLFAVELHSSRLAELSESNIYDWKKANIITKGELNLPKNGQKTPSSSILVMDKTKEMSDFSRKYAAYELVKKRRDSIRKPNTFLRGIGLSVAYQGNGFLGKGEIINSHQVSVRLEKDGKLFIKTSAVPASLSTRYIWMETAGEILGLPKKDIMIEAADTCAVPDAGPSTLSRNITVVNLLIQRACLSIKKQRFRKPLPLEVKKRFTLPPSYSWNETTMIGQPFPSISWGGACVEVEVDAYSLEIGIKGIWMAIEAGHIKRQLDAFHRLEADIYQSLGWAQDEQLSVSGGVISRKDYLAYKLPTITEAVPIEVDFVKNDKQYAPKGIGEIAFNTIPAAFVSAVSQATGYYIDDLPVTPERIYGYMEG